MSFRNVLEEHMNALPVSTVKKIISKYNKELDIRGYSKMKKAEIISAVKAKKPMNKTLLAKLTKEMEDERKSRGDKGKEEPKKGMKSKTMPGKEDFTTKKGSKDFDRGGKREKTAEGSSVKRKPFKGKFKVKGKE